MLNMKQLYLSLNKADLMFKGHTEQGEVDFILLETYENGTTTSVDINTFETFFGDVEGKPTYKALSGSHTGRYTIHYDSRRNGLSKVF